MFDAQTSFAKLAFGRGSRVRIYQQLERLIKNGVPVHRALDIVWQRASRDGRKPDAPEAYVIARWAQAYKSGTSLGEAVAGWVPYQEQMLIEAGELSGKLADGLRQVIEMTKATARVRAAFIGGLAYPMTLLLAIVGALWGFGANVIPPFADILPAERWTGGAAQMRWLSEVVQNWTIPILILIGVLLSLYISTVAVWTGRLRALADRVPPWSMYRMWQGTGFMLAMAALVRAGVAIPDALRRIHRHASPYLGERLEATLFHVNSGANLGEALHQSELGFPDPEIVDDMRIYASLSGFETSLEQIARDWLDTSVERVNTQARTINVLMLFLMAGVIGWLAWGLFELQKQVTMISGG